MGEGQAVSTGRRMECHVVVFVPRYESHAFICIYINATVYADLGVGRYDSKFVTNLHPGQNSILKLVRVARSGGGLWTDAVIYFFCYFLVATATYFA